MLDNGVTSGTDIGHVDCSGCAGHCEARGGGHIVITCGASWRRVLSPFVHTAPSSIHEEIRNCRGVKTQLSCNGNLHFFRWSLGLLKYFEQLDEQFMFLFGRTHVLLCGTDFMMDDYCILFGHG